MQNESCLVAYFSCSGRTEKVARALAAAAGADLYRIRPAQPYTAADLDWTKRDSRSSVEMADPSSRPAVADRCEGMDAYRVVFVGFPIWWYVAPRIVQTFLESYDFSGKTVIPFCTSGGSGVGRTDAFLHASCPPSVRWKPARLWKNADEGALRAWLKELGV